MFVNKTPIVFSEYYFLCCVQVCIHHVPELQTVSSVAAMVLVIIVLVATFILSSYLGL